MKTYTVAVLGATGAVGQEMIKVLQEPISPSGSWFRWPPPGARAKP